MLGGRNGGSREEEGLMEERKVGNSRGPFKGLVNSKSSTNLLRDESNAEAMVSEGPNSPKRSRNFDDNFSGLSRDGLIVQGGFLKQENKVWISLSMKSKHEALELKRKLEGEREIVRSVMRKIEVNDEQKNGEGKPRMMKQLCENSTVDNADKEKRMPKKNNLYKNSEFLPGKDKTRAPEVNKKMMKPSGKKGVGSAQLQQGDKFPNHVLKSCNAVLERLMKHKHSWVFNKPVDAVGLGLHDYFDIIKNPMDLGTVKDRLAKNWYESPLEFSEDVRLTFRNAMTYNPKGQDVYLMAEQLLKIFEGKWGQIEADYMRELKLNENFDAELPTPISRDNLPQSRAMPKTMDRSESMASSIAPKRKTMSGGAQFGKIPVPKKPKAKDPNKREMTYEEKQKLSINLQSLPSEKLENVVHIIKKRNPTVSQQDDEIEVDIDSVDTETLWELDRFITNYKKSVSKNKRMAELASGLTSNQEQSTKEKITTSVATETEALKESRKDEEPDDPAPVEVHEPGNNDTNQGASRSSSTSDSGSSSSDSDRESSSGDGSKGGPSPKKC